MPEKKHRERGLPLEPEQRTFIDRKLQEEGLSVRAAAELCGISERSLRNALDGKRLDPMTFEAILDALGAPDIDQLRQDHVRRFNLPRERNGYFTGREAKMKALCAALQDLQFAAITQALSGLGGMGKTSTAIEYAYRCLDKANFKDYPHYKAIQFTRADTVDELKNGYANIANALQLHRVDPNSREEAVRAVIDWTMQPENAPWLLILDNMDEPDLLKEFLPQAPQRHYGHILITSRSHRFAHRIKRVDLEAMDEEEGITFLYHRTARERIPGSEEEQAAKSLVAEMGGLPLALEQACAYMTNGIEMPFEDYVTRFRNQKLRSDQMNYAPEYGDYKDTVRTTWQMSLAEIEPNHPEAVQLLRLCAFLHPVGIPRELVMALLPDYFAVACGDVEDQKARYNSLLSALTGYSLIQRNLNNNTHSVHVMVQTVMGDELTSEEQQRAWERILTAIARSFPSEDYVSGGRGALYYPHAERLRAYVEQTGLEDETVGSLLNHMGSFLYYQGRFAEAEPLLTRALAIRQATRPSGHPECAMSLNNLAVLYRDLRRFDEAEPLFQQALFIRQSALNEDPPDLAESRKNFLESLNNLAALYQSQQRFEEAGTLYEKALEMKRRWLPEDHRTIVLGINNLAVFYRELGRFEEADHLFQEALERTRLQLSATDPFIAVGLTNLGVSYRNQRRYEEAEARLQEALQRWDQVYPEGHSTTAKCLSYLAVLYRIQERFEEAEARLQEALAMREKVLPADHPDIVESRNNLAECAEARDAAARQPLRLIRCAN